LLEGVCRKYRSYIGDAPGHTAVMSMFAAATKKAASARFKQPQLDAEGQQIEVSIKLREKVGVVIRLQTTSSVKQASV